MGIMDGYRASNGYIIRPCDNGGIEVGKPGFRDYTGPGATFALEEFFQRKSDTDSGRWRWPLNPHLVVYRVGDRDDVVLVVNETAGQSVTYTREQACAGGLKWGLQAARAFFDAHGLPVSEPRPWETAVAGEAWLLTVGGEQRPWIVERGRFESGGSDWLHKDSHLITAGVPLWRPEVVSS